MACGRTLVNHQDGESIGKAPGCQYFSSNIKQFFTRYEITSTSAHKEILLDFAESEANAFEESFGSGVSNTYIPCLFCALH